METRIYEFLVEGEKFFFDGKTFQILKGKGKILDDFPVIQLLGKPPRLSTLALTVTNNCNMGCSYCYAGQGSWDRPGYEMSYETAVRSVNLLLENVQKKGESLATLTFFGGEPLLRFSFIRHIVTYAKEKASDNVNLRFALVTNGTLIDQEKLAFLKEKRFVLSLSLDGDKELHDKHRTFKNGLGTYRQVIKKAKMALKEMPVLIRSTISNHNHDVTRVFQHINALGFKRISYELDHGMTESKFAEFLDYSENFFQWYLNQIRSGNYFDFRNITQIIGSILTKRRSKSHCNAGVGYMCVSADGKLYPCHRFIGESNLSRGIIGSISLDRLELIVKESDSLLKTGPADRHEKCYLCPFKYLCGGACPYQAYIHTGKLLEVYERGCQYKKIFFDQALRLLVQLDSENRKKFINFLIDLWQEESGAKGVTPFAI